MSGEEEIIQKAKEFVRSQMQGDPTGHDWYHIERVSRIACLLAEKEDADLFITQLTALLHDLDDWKFTGSHEPIKAKEFLEKLGVEEKTISEIIENIKEVSFKGSGVNTKPKLKEAMIVQDADRLDAMGAIGIARCFATGVKIFGNPIYDPELTPQNHKSFEEYKKSKTTSINHFHEKLLLLKDLMNTESAKKIAEERHRFMEEFLDRFLKEWEGKD